MKQRTLIYVLGALLAVLGVALYYEFRGASPAAGGVLAADTKFVPLDVHEPELRIDLLKRLSQLEYSGTHRNIFVAGAPPLAVVAAPPRFVGPPLPPVPPPLQVPAEYFGYAMQPHAGRRVAFLTSGEDVLLVAEGDTFLNRFRLARVGDESLDVEEISTGRHASLPIAAAQAASP